MKVDWTAHHPPLNFQLRKQGLMCNDLKLKSIERSREQSNALYAAGFIDGDTLEAIRLKMLDKLTKSIQV
jgi:hypothetical protein